MAQSSSGVGKEGKKKLLTNQNSVEKSKTVKNLAAIVTAMRQLFILLKEQFTCFFCDVYLLFPTSLCLLKV